MSKEDDEKAIDFQIESAEINGISCTTVKDGHVFIFKKDFMEKLLKKYPDNDTFTIFVQRREFKG